MGLCCYAREMEAALGTRQCILSNVPWFNFWVPKDSLQLKFTAECGLLMVMTVLVCALCFNGSQNPWLGRKSHGYSFWDADGVIHMDFLEPGTTISSEHYKYNTHIFETVIKKSSEAQEERFAVMWQRWVSHLLNHHRSNWEAAPHHCGFCCGCCWM